MYNQDYDGQDSYDQPYPTTQPTTQPTATQQGLQPVPGHPGLYYNTAGVVFNEAGTTVDGYVNPATGAFQTGTPTTNATTGIVGPPTPTAPKDPVVDPTLNPNPAPPPTGGGAPAPTPTAAPTPIAPSPNVTPAQPTPPPAFKYDDFTAPDPNELSSDPGFQFENAEGMRAIGARNAALGTLNTGGTLKDYVTFGQNLAHTRYGDLFNRRLTQYGTNRANAVGTYNENYGTQYQDPWNEQFQRAGMEQQNNQYNSSQAFNTWLENYKRSTLDPFDMKYKTLGLLDR